MDDTEIIQTLVHEMAHQWQHHHGKPSRGGYHNKQWAAKMAEIGLMPSSTGEHGGKQTGQSMSDYVITGGAFASSWETLRSEGFKIGWESRPWQHVPFIGGGDDETGFDTLTSNESQPFLTIPPPRPKSKVKYTCPGCEINVWGKPALRLICGMCFHAEDKKLYLEEIENSGS